MTKVKNWLIVLSLILSTTLIILSCDRSSVGFDQLDRELAEPVPIILKPTAAASYGRYIANGFSSNLILGKNPQYESRVLLKFNLPDSALEQVTEVKLIIYTRRQANLNFNVYRILEEWNPFAATWYRPDSLFYWFSPGGYFSEASIGSGQITEESTVVIINDVISLVRNSYGLILIPQDTGFGLFYSNETGNRPKLIFKYSADERKFDCLGDASIIDSLDLTMGRYDLWIGSGYAFRTYLKFETDTFPEQATITSAELVLHPDLSFLISDTVEIGIHKFLEPYEVRAKFSPNISAKARFTDSDSIIRFDMRSLIQFWNLHPDSNFGFLITAYPEYSDIFRIELKNAGTERPYLNAFYILPPIGKF
ncbi:MAG: DNRLRE domain-containing protein [candidate division WOR-3 bacterium]|nr:DNRLRE domain-containing protein [candidate division WOR-3 bacterium]